MNEQVDGNAAFTESQARCKLATPFVSKILRELQAEPIIVSRAGLSLRETAPVIVLGYREAASPYF